MSYSTVNEFLTVYPKLNGIGPDQIGAFLARGAATIDGYLAGAIAVPATPSPPLLVSIEQDLAYVGILKRNTVEASKDTTLKDLYDEAIQKLEDIRDGKITLLSSTGAVITTGQRVQIWSSVEGYVPTFGVSDIEDAWVDSDRLEEEAAARK
jgi:phage gp36-like protein